MFSAVKLFANYISETNTTEVGSFSLVQSRCTVPKVVDSLDAEDVTAADIKFTTDIEPTVANNIDVKSLIKTIYCPLT